MRKFFLFFLPVLLFSACNADSRPVGEPNEEDIEIVVEHPIPEDNNNEQSLVEAYVKENISLISPIQPVLGGSWYVVEIEFEEDSNVQVLAEDGHIQVAFSAKYSVAANGEVSITDVVEE